MSKRSAKSVAALFVSVLAGAHLATVTDLRAQAASADDCLTAPKGATTPGSHWYYRIDRATKRQCWYLREEGDKSTRATPPVSAPATSAAAAEPAEQPSRTITRKAISEARAEYISQQSRAEQTPPANLASQTTGAATSTPAVQDSKRTAGANVLAPTPLATTRWLEGTGANASSNPADVRTAAVANSSADQQQADAEPVQQPALQQPALLQPATGNNFAAAELIDEANGVVADAARGDGCRARAGRHHGEPGLQAGPHPRSACHAASAACDVGFSQKQAVSAATAFGAANTCSTARAVSAAGAISSADVPSRGSPGAAH